jgi:phosphonatase-like hydrolase
MAPALVVLDMAGTTVEDRGQVPTAFAATLSAHGIPLTADEISRVRGSSKRQAIRSLLPPSEAGKAEAIYLDFCRSLREAYHVGGVHCVPGADRAIHDLRGRGIKVALTTGFGRDIAALLLASLGWTSLVDAVVCGDDVEHGRPSPEMILLAMKLTGVEDPSRVANAGDTVLDLESAARAGVRWNIGVLSGAHTRPALERAPHTHIVQSVAELLEVFER